MELYRLLQRAEIFSKLVLTHFKYPGTVESMETQYSFPITIAKFIFYFSLSQLTKAHEPSPRQYNTGFIYRASFFFRRVMKIVTRHVN